ncbi:MAG: hypothetical protein KY445_14345 [Armatimonadetes bacterium]|nr:hypothetical protein [Armatimonadota bacterium]
MKIQNLKAVRGSTKVMMGLAVLCGLAPWASATPATLGFYPSTDIYPKNTFHLDVDSYGRGVKTDALVSSGLTYGIGPETSKIFGRSEVGLDYLLRLFGTIPATDPADDIGGTSRLIGNFKTQVYDNPSSATRVVLGAWGLGSRKIFAPSYLYLTSAKSFEFGRVHLGIARSLADRDVIAAPSGSSDRTSLHLGYDRYFANNKLQFAVDYYSGKNAVTGVQPTLYYYINDKANFGVGYFRANDASVAPSRNQVYLCFDYNFGGPPAAAPAAPPVPETAPTTPATN